MSGEEKRRAIRYSFQSQTLLVHIGEIEHRLRILTLICRVFVMCRSGFVILFGSVTTAKATNVRLLSLSPSEDLLVEIIA